MIGFNQITHVRMWRIEARKNIYLPKYVGNLPLSYFFLKFLCIKWKPLSRNRYTVLCVPSHQIGLVQNIFHLVVVLPTPFWHWPLMIHVVQHTYLPSNRLHPRPTILAGFDHALIDFLISAEKREMINIRIKWASNKDDSSPFHRQHSWFQPRTFHTINGL